MKSARAAFQVTKQPAQSGDYSIRKGRKVGNCFCRTSSFTGGQYAVKKALNEIRICQLPFNTSNLNINLVTKNDFTDDCVIQTKLTNTCDPKLDANLPPYLYYNLYPHAQICTLNNFNNNWNRVYYPAKEN